MTTGEKIRLAGIESARLARVGTRDGWMIASPFVRLYHRAAVAAKSVGLPDDHATCVAVLAAEPK